MKIKICGITNIADAKFCVDLGADAIGFIFYKKSKRYVSPNIVRNIIQKLPSFVAKVGVFVNEEIKRVNEIAGETKLNIVQLHGDESPEYLKEIDYSVIKAFRVDDDFEFENLRKYLSCSFLFDSYNQKEYGGTGVQFDWEIIPNSLKDKIILAGGVSEHNIEFIYNEISPYAIDVSSSVETEPGKKDHIKLNRLFEKYYELRKA